MRKRRAETVKIFIHTPINKKDTLQFDELSSTILSSLDIKSGIKAHKKGDYHITLLKGHIPYDRRNIGNFIDYMSNIASNMNQFDVKLSDKLQKKAKRHAIVHIDDSERRLNQTTKTIKSTN